MTYPSAFRPSPTKDQNVFRFSGEGDVMKMFEYPCAIAEETASPKAADFPRPREAVKVTVEESVFSSSAVMNVKRACAWISSDEQSPT